MATNGSLKFTLPIAVVVSVFSGVMGSYWTFTSESRVDRAEMRARIDINTARLDKLETYVLSNNETLKRIEVTLATIGTKLGEHMATDRVPGPSSALPRTDGSPNRISDKPAKPPDGGG